MNSLFIALNMLRRTLFHKKGLLLHLLIPAIAVSLIIGLLGGQEVHQVHVRYINMDQGTMGHLVLEELASLPDYRLQAETSEVGLKEDVIKQKSSVAFLIPEGFSEQLLRGSSAEVTLYQLSTNEASIILKMNLDSIVSRLQQTITLHADQGLKGSTLLEAVDKTWNQMKKHQVNAHLTDYNLYVNPGMHIVIGFMLMFMMVVVNNTVAVIMEDRRQRTMARTYTAPVRALEIMVGNLLGSFLVGTLQILVILLVTRYITHYEYGLPFLPQFIILEFFLLASMGIASAVAGMVRNSTNMSIINSLVITPTCMLGGCFWPISLMPEWMQKMANFVPQKWAIDAIARMASGQTLSQMWMHMGVLTLFALILLGVGSVILKPGEAEAG
ncbi:ABC transporter permease [Paenibacillus sp. N3.4]|uniref:ABC transporter permease n=1 Tax=Paenibacillus sp. N3.4 TaxID=2603222 RepID=UPI0011CAD3DC|nr:ABC transporter permease [Paenibacillus sp. N3.4]TXK85775.1 ABC transporter permease [Paenibacillus sp. N3.4]